jgi:hypothetical protein
MKIKGRSDTPDLQTQLESMFDQVWRSEDNWQLWDRIEAMVAREVQREQRDLLPRPKPRA